jgi:hypothetical protein
MLYLSADGSHHHIPLPERTALRLERALLSGDRAARRRELVEAFQDDQEAAGWALRAAESRLGRTINRVDEAAEWLSGCLEMELAAALTSENGFPPSGEIAWRLPALVAKLCAYERQSNEFHERLEREKLASLKELAYGASHEINNPLANIAGRAQTLLAEETDPERQRKLAAIHRQAMRAHELIADVMLFARPPKLNLAPCELIELVRRVVDQLRELASEYDVKLVCESADESVRLSADATQLGVAVHAVIVNALEAAGGGHVRVVVRQKSVGAEPWAEVAVHDDGPGISDEVRRHMFDPFYSGREAGRGLGFGLSKCWRIVTDHGGQVVVQRPAGGGAQIEILLPLTPSMVTQS